MLVKPFTLRVLGGLLLVVVAYTLLSSPPDVHRNKRDSAEGIVDSMTAVVASKGGDVDLDAPTVSAGAIAGRGAPPAPRKAVRATASEDGTPNDSEDSSPEDKRAIQRLEKEVAALQAKLKDAQNKAKGALSETITQQDVAA